jgi:hypothetical protein
MSDHVPEPVPPQPQKEPPRPFAALRVDPKKAEEGVWIQHPDTEDELRVGRMWSARHLRAYEQARLDYVAKHGEEAAATPEGAAFIEAVAIATGVVVDWRLRGNPDRRYDAAQMAALLVEPEYADLGVWIRARASQRDPFKHVAGN